jgi:hypothetical protein
LNSLLQCMYLTPELRAAVYAIPAAHLESAANYPGNKTAAVASTTVSDSTRAPSPVPVAPPREPTPPPPPPPPKATPSLVKPDYDLETIAAMGFDFDMVLRVAQLYPRDANACIECLLGGGVPEDTAPAPAPASRPQSSGGDKFYNADDYADISTANGTKRRRYDPNADQSLVTSRALIVVPQAGDGDSSSAAPAPTSAASSTAAAAPVRRSTAADVLFELQSLFATLQMSQSGAISTRALTDSFGWRSSQAVQQQDVHELNRMLFDVIERALRRTPQAKLVQQLYGGATTTSLRCEVCNTERRRADALLDLPLSLRDAQTVHAALAIACGSERLTESNRLTCEVCNARQDTTRSVRLGRLASTPLSNQAPPPPSDAEAAAASTTLRTHQPPSSRLLPPTPWSMCRRCCGCRWRASTTTSSAGSASS